MPPTTAPATPLPRTQDQLVERMRLRLADTSDEEMRHIPLSEVLDRAHADQVIAEGDPVPAMGGVLVPRAQFVEQGWAENAPTYHRVMAGVVQQLLPALLRQIRVARQSLDALSEYAWILGHDQVAHAMVPDGHAALGHTGLVEVVRFCRAFAIPLPGEQSDEGVAPDLADAIATLDREQTS